MPVLSEVHQATTRYLCLSIFNLPFSPICPHGVRLQKLLLRNLKRNRNRWIHFYRFTVQQEWSITPLSDCLEGSWCQHRMATHEGKFFDLTGLADDCLEDNLSRDTSRQRYVRILRFYLLNQETLGDALRD